jgi:DNA repair protein RecN (Recombination protein N)
MIRPGCERAEIAAAFELAGCPQARAWLVEQDLDDGEECLVRRLLVRAGRSRAYVNARPVTGAQLQALGELLVDIHGQHAHQSLLRPAAQRALLDGYAGHATLAEGVAGRYRDFRGLDVRLRRLEQEGAERTARLSLLREQVEELESLGIAAGEIEELDREQRRLANLGDLQATAARLLDALYDGDSSLHAILGRAVSDLDTLTGFDERLAGERELVEGAAIQVEEAAVGLRQYLDGLEIDPGVLDQVESRLAQIHDTARKYRLFPQQLPDALTSRRAELAELERDDLALGDLGQQRDSARAAFLAEAERLSDLRLAAAARLSETVSASMQELGMTGGRFAVELERVPPDEAGAFGLDRVLFLVSANLGQPLQPLAKVASGGELSRISLCIQVAAAECAGVPTLVFDEVDVGIGGRVAEIVGRLLRTLGDARQVLCVTHLPQVAAQAHSHLRVHKHSRNGQTFAAIAALDIQARVEEIARMLGGMEITEKTLDHAGEMIARAGAASPASEPSPRP